MGRSQSWRRGITAVWAAVVATAVGIGATAPAQASVSSVSAGSPPTAALVAGTGTVRGVVRGPNGALLAGVRVSVRPERGSPSTLLSAVSGADGRYAVAGVPRPGIEHVCVDPAGSGDALLMAECPSGVGPTLFGDGNVIVRDLWLRHGALVTGVVRSTSGAPIAGAIVSGYDDRNSSTYRTTTGADGSYAMAVRPTGQHDSLSVCVRDPRVSTAAPRGYAARCVRGLRAGGAPVDVTLSPGAAVAGRLVDPAGRPVPGAVIQPALDAETDGGLADLDLAVTTGTDGNFVVTGLPTGYVWLDYGVAGLLGNRGTGFMADRSADVMARAGRTITLPRHRLRWSGALRGMVLGAGGVPLPGVWVTARDPGLFTVRSASAADGSFVITGLSTATYTVSFDPSARAAGPGKGYLPATWKDATDQWTATPVDVTEGKLTGGVRQRLRPGAAVAGVVRTSAGRPLGGVSVTNGSTAATTTLSDGTYRLTGLEPQATITALGDVPIEMVRLGLLDQSATPVLTPGKVAKQDFALALAGGVSGRVTGARGVPLPGAVAFDQWGHEAVTGSDGSYLLRGLDPGSVSVCFDADSITAADARGYLSECFDDAPDQGSVTQVAVSSGTVTGGVSARLTPGGVVTGTLTLPAGSTGAAWVRATHAETGQSFTAYTTATGRYRITGLRAGMYAVCVEVSGDLQRECWEDVAVDQVVPNVAVAAGQVVSGIDFSLARQVALSGVVLDSRGSPIADAVVELRLDSGMGGVVAAEADGSYRVPGVDRGTARVCAEPVNRDDLLGQCWKDLPGDTWLPTPIPVGATDVTDINFSLPDAAVISGTVTDTAGQPLPHVSVSSDPPSGSFGYAESQADGSFRVGGLVAGTYTLCFEDVGAYVRACHDPITVAAGERVSGIVQVMTRQASIAGLVTDASGPVAYPWGEASDAAGQFYAMAGRDDGSYRIALPPGTYSVCVWGGYGGYQDECFDNVVVGSGADPTPVIVGDGQARTGVDIHLDHPL